VNKRIVFSVVAGVVVFIAVARLSGPAHCVDGWMSSSIGHRGACSHHGGVADNPLDLLFGIAAGFLAYYVWGALTALRARRVARTPTPATSKPPEESLTWMPKKIERQTWKVDVGAVIAKGTLVVVSIVIAIAASAAVHEAMVLTGTDDSTATVKTLAPALFAASPAEKDNRSGVTWESAVPAAPRAKQTGGLTEKGLY
jgi:hypothetical protein